MHKLTQEERIKKLGEEIDRLNKQTVFVPIPVTVPYYPWNPVNPYCPQPYPYYPNYPVYPYSPIYCGGIYYAANC